MSTLRALKHRSFALIWTGQTLSRLGDFVYEIALSWWILQKTGSAEFRKKAKTGSGYMHQAHLDRRPVLGTGLAHYRVAC